MLSKINYNLSNGSPTKHVVCGICNGVKPSEGFWVHPSLDLAGIILLKQPLLCIFDLLWILQIQLLTVESAQRIADESILPLGIETIAMQNQHYVGSRQGLMKNAA